MLLSDVPRLSQIWRRRLVLPSPVDSDALPLPPGLELFNDISHFAFRISHLAFAFDEVMTAYTW
jgi:hypothetical protein